MDAKNYNISFRKIIVTCLLIILSGSFQFLFAQNYALNFDGSGDYIIFGNPASWYLTGDQTIEMWINPSDFSARRNPVAKAYAGEGTMTLETNGTINYYYGTGGGNNSPYQTFGTGTAVAPNEWTHVALVRDLTNMKLYWYINGTQVNVANAEFPAAVRSTLAFYIGHGYVSDFKGMIDEVRVWSEARTSYQIAASKNVELTGSETGLVGYWKFNEGSGSMIFDQSDYHVNGNIVGNTSFVLSGAPVYQSTLGNEPFEPVPPTGLPYNIVLADLTINGQEIPFGAQIGVFDGELCVGTTFYNGVPNQNLTAWQADPEQNLAGFTPGNLMTFKYHTAWYSEIRNFDATAFFVRGNGNFGNGIFSVVNLSATTDLIPDVAISESILNFNTVIVNQSKTLSLIIQNNGTAVLHIDSFQKSDSHFTLSKNSAFIAAGEEDTLLVTFIPTAVTTYSDMLHISCDDPDTPSFEIPLYGTGLPQPSPQISVTPAFLDFGGIAMNTTKSMNLNIYNAGNGTLQVTGITSSNGVFSIFGSTTFTLGQNENRNIAVIFSPVASGAFSGNVSVITNTGTTTVPITGVASQGHFSAVAPTGKPYTIVVDDASVDGFRPKVGDEIAVYDDELCVGVGIAKSGGNSLKLDGNGDFLINNNSTAFDLQQLTISAWVYSTNFNQNGFIFEKGPVNTQYSLFFEGASLNFRTYPSNGSGYDNFYNNSASLGIENNKWNFITATYDGNYKKIFVNGTLRASVAYSKLLRTGQVGQIIGAYGGSGSTSYYFNGNIDEVRVWDHARTLFEIQDDMFHNLRGTETGLVGYWNFDSGNPQNLVAGATTSYLNGNASTNGISNPNLFSDMIITAWEKDDVLGLPGFTSGNPMTFKIWTEVYDHWVDVAGTPDYLVGNGNFGYGQFTMLTLTGTSGFAPEIDVPIESLYVGQVTVGQSVVNEITIHNLGNANLYVSISDNSTAFSSGTTSAVITESDSLTFEVTFAPTVAGGYSSVLTIESNDPDEIKTFVSLEGFALPSGQPDIATSVDYINFGNVGTTGEKTSSFFVINTGTSALIVTNIQTNDPAFTITPVSFTLQNTNDLKEVFVTFSPDVRGNFNGTLTITSNSAAKVLNLEGVGIEDHFDMVEETGLPYTIIIETTNLDDLIVPGDELAVFDGELCVGMAYISEPLNQQNVTITAWQKDTQNGLPGFTTGNPMSYKVWTYINNIPTELHATPTYITGNGNFGYGQFSIVSLEFGLPQISVSPTDIFVALNEPDSVQKTISIQNNGTEYLYYKANLDDDPIGKSLALDGVNDYVALGNLSPGSQWTAEAWVKPSSTPSGRKAILGGFSSCNDWGIMMSGGMYGVGINPPTECSQSVVGNGTGIAEIGKWAHVAATSDGTTARLYVNGEFIASAPVLTNYTGYNGDVRIGGEACCSGNNFPGLIDEVRLWNYARTQSEINMSMYEPLAGNETGLRAYWNFDDGTATDISGNGHNGNLLNGASINTPGTPGTISWVHAPAAMDTVEPGQTVLVDLMIYSEGLIDGLYQSNLIIANNTIDAPEVVVPITLNVTGNPQIAASESTVVFENVVVNETAETAMYFQNIGSKDLVIDEIYIPDGGSSAFTFEVTGKTFPYTVSPGDLLNILVSFTPLSPGIAYDSLIVVSNAGNADSLVVYLSGEGITPPDIYLPQTSFSYTFACNDDYTESIKIFNHGQENLTFQLTANMPWLAASPNQGIVAGGDSSTVAIHISTLDLFAGQHQAVLSVASNDPDQANTLVNYSLVVTGDPAILCNDFLAIGTGNVGDTLVAQLLVANSGCDTLQITSATFGSQQQVFFVNNPVFSVAPGNAEALLISFAPVASQQYSAILTIASNDAANPGIPVVISATGVEPPNMLVSPLSINATLQSGESAQRLVTVQNTGGELLQYNTTVSPLNQFMLYLDGNGDYINVVHNDVLNPGNALTLETWVYLVDNTDEFIMGKENSTEGKYRLWVNAIHRFEFKLNNQFSLSSNAVAAKNQWTHIAATFDGEVMRIFINGVLDAEQEFAPFSILANTDNLRIGRSYQYAFLNGKLDEVRIWNIARNQSEIQSTMHQPLLGSEPELLLYFPFINSSGNIISDASLNSNNGILYGNPIRQSSTIPFNDYLQLSNATGSVSGGLSKNIILGLNSSGFMANTYQREVMVSGNALQNPSDIVELSLTINGTGTVEPLPAQLQFDDTFIGLTDTLNLVLKNTGALAANVTGLSFSSAVYSSLDEIDKIFPFSQKEIRVVFEPAIVQMYNETLTVILENAGVTEIQIPLAGLGVTPPVPVFNPVAALFGNVVVSNSGVVNMELSNTGSSDLVVYSASFTDGQHFSSDILLPQTIAFGEQVSFDVSFTPSNYNAINGEMVFSTNVGMISLPLSGTGVPPDHDLSIVSVIAPTSGCGLSSAESLTVNIRNFGELTQTNFDVGFSLNSGATVVETVIGTLQSGYAMQYTFNQKLNLVSLGTYNLQLFSLLANDQNTHNDTLVYSITNSPSVGNFTNLLPADSSFGVVEPVSFSWTAVPNATLYDLYLWRTSQQKPATPTVAGITGTSYIYYEYLNKNYLYNWQIRARNQCSQSESNVRIFSFNVFSDLTVNQIVIPESGYSGDNVEISYTIANIGTGSTGYVPWVEKVYISPTSVFNAATAMDLGTFNNLSVLSGGQSYTKTVSVTLPNYLEGAKYIFVRTDVTNKIQETNEDNNTVASTGTLQVLLPPYPDLAISGVQSLSGNIIPGQALTVGWSVENTGDADAIGGWSQRISILQGANRQVLGYVQNPDTLESGGIISQSANFNVPAYPGMDGQIFLEIVLTPYPALVEKPNGTTNNTALSTESILMEKHLVVTMPRQTINENATSPLQCMVYRSGNRTNALVVNLAVLEPDRVVFPATVTIPANQSGAGFTISAINNALIEGDIDLDLSAEATGYNQIFWLLTVLDDEAPSLFLNTNLTEVTEGDKFQLTVSRDLVTASAQSVALSVDKSSQIVIPAVVNIPANEASITIEIDVVDDYLPELTKDVIISATATGFIAGTKSITILDNDLPPVELTINPDTVSEAGGPYAAWGTVQRLTPGNGQLIIQLSADPAGGIFFPAQVTIPAGQLQKQFNIGAVDNGVLDGDRVVEITAAVYISSCGCGAPPESGGTATASITLIDNDGPSLAVASTPFVVPEGMPNIGVLTITRNTLGGDELLVNIQHNSPTEIILPSTAIIPQGEDVVEVPFSTLDDGIEDGDKVVSVNVSSEGYSSGNCWIMVSDRNLPDYVLKNMEVSQSSVLINDQVDVTVKIANNGFAIAPVGAKVNIYKSTNNVLDNNDPLLTTMLTPTLLTIGDSVVLNKTLTINGNVGDYFLFATVNREGLINELIGINNTSEAKPLSVLPDYTATATVEGDVFNGTTSITITGVTEMAAKTPAPNKPVDVYVIVNGVRRVLSATSDIDGNFSINFTPLNGEAGDYTIGACYPGQGSTTAQDSFILLGAKHTASGYIIWNLWLGETKQQFLEIKNFSSIDLNNVKVEVISQPPGCNMTFLPVANLPGNSYATLSYSVEATAVTAGTLYEEVKLKLTSAEGTVFRFSAWFYSSATKGNIKLNPVVINTTMVKGTTNYTEFVISNNGLDETGLISIDLPDADWLSLASTDTVSSLQPGASATVTLRLTPGDDLQLNNPITGQLAISGTNANSVVLPFIIEPISDETGDLLVDVVDEYTYNTAQAPHLENATVIVSHPYTGQIIAQGLTDVNGHFLIEDINEGYYTLKVQAPQHGSYQDYIYIDKGVINNKVVFIAFQAITYSWDVVPTLIEDEYEVTLVVEFETNVPAPVVVMNMPDTLPQLAQGQVFPFILTLTNHGLITAQDVEVTLPDDDEYMFTANVDQLDILPQQAVQIPVIMERRPPDQASGNRSLNCADITITKFKFECGPDDQMRIASAWSIYLGRICSGPGGPGGSIPFYWPTGGGGPGGPGGGWSGPGGGGTSIGPGTPYTSSNEGCDPCVAEALNCALDCVNPIPPVLDCGADVYANGLNWGNGVSCAWGLVDTFTGGSFGCAWCVGTTIGCFINSAISAPLAEGGKNLTELEQASLDMAMLDKGFVAIENWAKEYAGNDELFIKEDFGMFKDSVAEFINNEIPVEPETQNRLVVSFEDTDITDIELLGFFTYWNTTLEARGNGVYSPTPEYPDIVDTLLLYQYMMELDTVIQYVHGRGYPSMDSLYNASAEIVKYYLDDKASSVCATVTVQFSQTLTMTREAFEGTLTIFNGHETDAMQNIQLDLEVRDENGVIRNDLFQINTQSLDQISGIDGTGILNALTEGTAVIMFIPERGAAPDAPRYYSFGGTLSYLDPFTGEMFEQPLFPVTLQVNPSPNLYLSYFMQRDIFGDDALTEPIEPMIPAELAVMINNQGAGTAMSVNLESAQPEIIENEKGLLIDFAIVGSNLGGEPVQLGIFDVDFGDIPGGEIAVGQWWFTSTLLGHFISYEASVNHLDSYGNPDLSLVSGIEIHELIKSISVYGPLDDSINDFLVNDIPDIEDIPDGIYYSNGTIAPVVEAGNAVTDGPVTLNDTVVELTVTPAADGWNYTKMNDPGNGLYRIASCTRNDGQIIPLKNIWLTYSTIPDGGEPIYENKMHFVDTFTDMAVASYTIVFEPIDQDVPEVVVINGVPEAPTDTPVQNVEVVFSEPIEPTTFNYEDMTLKNQGGSNLMDSLVIVTQVNDSTFDVDISEKTHPNGYYTLVVQAAGVADLVGNFGTYGKQVSWLQAIATPAIDYFIGLPEEPSGPIDTLLVLFNMPINEATFTTDQLMLTDNNGDPVSTESLIITSVSFNNVLFKISGLQSLNMEDGVYELTFKLTEIQGENGQIGSQDQSISWSVCQVALPVAQAGQNASVCQGQSYQLSGAVENAGSFAWSTSGTGTFDSNLILAPLYTPSAADIAAGSVQISLVAQPLNECASAASSSMNLHIQKQPVANAGVTANICDNQTHQLYGTVSNAGSYFWTTSGDGTFSNNQILTPVYTPGTADKLSGIAELKITALAVSPCVSSVESFMVLNIHPSPIVDAGPDAVVCENEPYRLSGSVENESSFVWSTAGDGTFDHPDVLNPLYTQGTQDKLDGQVTLNLFAQAQSPCFFAQVSTITLTLQYLPIANAGDNVTICEGQTVQLQATVENQKNFFWGTNGDGTFTSPVILNPVYTPGPEDIANGTLNIILLARPTVPCYYSDVSQIVITIRSLPVSNAGADATICEGQTYQLSGNAENAGSIIWETSGDGTFNAANILNAVYTPGVMDIQNATADLSLTVAPLSPCALSDVSSLNLAIQAAPSANAGADATICENQSLQLAGSLENGNGFHWETSGDGIFDDNGILDAVYTPGVLDVQNSAAELSLVADPIGPCSISAVSSITLHIQQLATAFAGDDATICENQVFDLSGSVANQSSFNWITSGDGIFDDSQSLQATYTPGVSDIQNAAVELSLIAESISPCALNSTSTLVLTIQHSASVNAGQDANICHDESFGLSGTVENASSALWTTDGDGTFDDPNSANAAYYPGQADIAAGEVNLKLYAESVSPCALQATDELLLNINQCHRLIVQSGWSGISTYVEPVEPSLDSVFSSVLSDLVILQSQSGIFWPGQNINTIGLWDTYNGYSIKMETDANLTMVGSRAGTNLLDLNNGWSIMPVLSACDVDVESLFAGTNVTIVKEVAGWKVYWPGLNINTLQSLQSGKAYYVLMNDNSGIAFPVCSPGSSPDQVTKGADIFDGLQFNPWNTYGSNPNTHIIGIPDIAVGGGLLRKGDLVGVFNQAGQCYGIAFWDETNAAIAVVGDDATTPEIDGFVEGEPMLFRIFVTTTGQEHQLDITFRSDAPQSDGMFHDNGLSVIENLKVGSLNVSESNTLEAMIYPNPANDKIFIDFNSVQPVHVSLFDVQGQLVLEQELSELRNQLDISTLRSGVYLIKLEGEHTLKVDRIIKK